METIGLIAGNGRFPFLVAEEIKRRGDRVAAIALREETDPALEKAVDQITWVALGQFQKMFDVLHAEGVTVALMAGQVKHAQLFAGLKLDWRAIKLLGRIANKKTDSILGAVADEFDREGIRLLPSHQYLTHLLPEPGLLCGTKLSSEEKKDAAFGHRMAKEIAGLDIGQTVVVKDQAVVAVESIEGTDECMRRAARYAGAGVVVVKVAKPKQDFRFDVPVVGVRTIDVLNEIKARALIIESGVTLLLDREQLLAAAAAKDVTIVAL
jgi:DUF1009 family protein